MIHQCECETCHTGLGSVGIAVIQPDLILLANNPKLGLEWQQHLS